MVEDSNYGLFCKQKTAYEIEDGRVGSEMCIRGSGEVVSLTEPPNVEKQYKHTIEVVVDRLVAKGDDAGAKRRLTDSVETALVLANGVLLIDFVDRDETDPERTRRFSERLACPNEHPLSVDEIEPRSVSYTHLTLPTSDLV